jgi:type VI secretion system protein ImpF
VIDIGPQERLQPALLDRLTDEEPGRTKPEPIDRRVMSKARFRAAVLRDLRWLLSATRLERGDDVKAGRPDDQGQVWRPDDLMPWPLIRESVLNYGLPALAGRTLSSAIAGMESSIREAIVRFEPRILPDDSLKIHVLVDHDDTHHHNVIGVRIQGRLWAEPVPIEVIVRTDFDLENGTVTMTDLQAPRVD